MIPTRRDLKSSAERWLRHLVVFLLLFAYGEAVGAQQPSPEMLRGVVWDVPENRSQVEADLRRMREIGVQAVRTPLIDDPYVLGLADSLGIYVFQELELDDLPAAALRGAVEDAWNLLEPALLAAREHPSARFFGLARRVDTSDPAACEFFETLAARVRQAGPQGIRVYYLSTFIETDRCARAVDFVLLDALDAPDPAGLLARWRDVHEVPVGIGALGTWTSSHARRGLRRPHSPETQARYLESHLDAVLDEDVAPVAVFVYRWRDRAHVTPSIAHDVAHPFAHAYGLLAEDGTPRRAFDVAAGFFTGRQRVFAYASGSAPPPEIPWTTLLGWVVVVLIAVCYASSTRLRHMVVRYFRARGFYREAVREGRDVLLGGSIVLLTALSLSVGVIVTVFLEELREERAVRYLYGKLALPIQTLIVGLLAEPWMMVLLVGSFYALGIALWTALLSALSRKRHPLIPGQALMLVLWPRWPLLAIMMASLVVPTLSDDVALTVLSGLAGLWLLLVVYATIRTLLDYAAISYVPGYFVALGGIFSPFLLLVLLFLLLVLETGPSFTYVWHLITRS